MGSGTTTKKRLKNMDVGCRCLSRVDAQFIKETWKIKCRVSNRHEIFQASWLHCCRAPIKCNDNMNNSNPNIPVSRHPGTKSVTNTMNVVWLWMSYKQYYTSYTSCYKRIHKRKGGRQAAGVVDISGFVYSEPQRPMAAKFFTVLAAPTDYRASLW